ncbi:MAG: hypothetical protein D6808_01905 [Candidatus Dadabacteria bacterium]|nr:MAG: hypothetical protein D6808_01905 [Candidatus Dadabacteria bacterium]
MPKTRLHLGLEALCMLVLAFILATAFLDDSPTYSVMSQGGEEEPNIDLTIYEKAKASPGLVLYPVTGMAEVRLLNIKGNTVHTWAVDATRARLLDDCSLLVVHGSKWGLNHEPWKSLRPVLRRYSWDGEILWEYTADDIIHHDVRLLPSGNLIFPVREILTMAQKSAIRDPERRALNIRSDKILEVKPSGEVVWEWHAHEHLDLNDCGKPKCKFKTGVANAEQQLSDWTHINTVAIVPENKWYDRGDTRFKPGNIITLPRNWWTVFIVDKGSGDIVWEYTGDYRGGLSGGHDPYMIPRGLPGEGNILVFDNGRVLHKGESYILEINPQTKKIEWKYEAGKSFFSRSAGTAQRLPNGNTFISEDTTGRIFEVTPDGKIVWEYQGQERTSRAYKIVGIDTVKELTERCGINE